MQIKYNSNLSQYSNLLKSGSPKGSPKGSPIQSPRKTTIQTYQTQNSKIKSTLQIYQYNQQNSVLKYQNQSPKSHVYNISSSNKKSLSPRNTDFLSYNKGSVSPRNNELKSYVIPLKLLDKKFSINDTNSQKFVNTQYMNHQSPSKQLSLKINLQPNQIGSPRANQSPRQISINGYNQHNDSMKKELSKPDLLNGSKANSSLTTQTTLTKKQSSPYSRIERQFTPTSSKTSTLTSLYSKSKMDSIYISTPQNGNREIECKQIQNGSKSKILFVTKKSNQSQQKLNTFNHSRQLSHISNKNAILEPDEQKFEQKTIIVNENEKLLLEQMSQYLDIQLDNDLDDSPKMLNQRNKSIQAQYMKVDNKIVKQAQYNHNDFYTKKNNLKNDMFSQGLEDVDQPKNMFDNFSYDKQTYK